MKIEKKVIHAITLDTDEKTALSNHLTAVQNATKSSICESISCGGITCADCPFNALTDLEEKMWEATQEFLKSYRAFQKDNPSLPSIN